MKRTGLSLWTCLGTLALVLGGCGESTSNCGDGEGAFLLLDVQPSTSLADGKSVIAVSVSGQNNECKPLPMGTGVNFSLSSANPSGVGQFSNGETSIVKTVNFSGAKADLSSTEAGTVEVNATVDSLGLTATPVTVTFDEPLPTGLCAMNMAAVPTSVIANGATQTTLTATLTGDDGQPIPDGTNVFFTTQLGAFSNSETTVTNQTSGGVAEAVLTSEIVNADTAVTVSSDAICNDRSKSKLHAENMISFIAARPTVTITPTAESILGDGVDSVDLTAQVHLNDGSPAGADVPVNFVSTLGNFGDASTYSTVTDSTGAATATLTGGTVGGTATVEATATIGNEESTGRQDIIVRGLKTVTLNTAESVVNGDDAQTSVITATVSLSDGSPAWAGIQVQFKTTLGSFTESSSRGYSTTTDASGQATATFLGGLDGGTAQVTATATVASTEVTSVPAAILVLGLESVVLSASTSDILADGVSTIALRAIVTLSNGARAWQGMDVTFTASSLGTFQGSGQNTVTTTTDANGEAVATIVAGKTGGKTAITATAQVGTKTTADTTDINMRALDKLNLTCANSAVLADGVSTILCTASAYLDDETSVGAGTLVDFTMAPSGGTFQESGKGSYQTTTNALGLATATFIPGIGQSLATITATATVQSQSVESTWQINVQKLSFIELYEVQNEKMGVRGSGRDETSRVTFQVNDANGDPLPEGCPVDFTLSTAPGTPSIGPTETVTNEFGRVWTTVRSGIAATSVTVTARAYMPDPTDPINNPPINEASATTSSIAIVGAKPNARFMTFSCDLGDLNRAGFDCDFLQTKCTVGLADRYTNQIGLETNVNFYVEAGTISASSMTKETGLVGTATTTAVTGNPDPQDVTPFESPVFEPRQYLAADDRTGNPRDGLVTIVATTTGEEEFTDLNANGEYDPGEPFIDLGEPFVDRNDNGTHDQGEFYVDVDQGGTYTDPNGAWDTDTVIWTQTWMMWSRAPDGYQVDKGWFLELGQSFDLHYGFWDENYNILNSESTNLDAALESDAGKINKTLSNPPLRRTIQDAIGIGIQMKKVKPGTSTACCVEISAECPSLDEICHLVPVVGSFSQGVAGTVRLEGEDLDTKKPRDDTATVNFDLDYRMCGQAETRPFSASGGFDGCHPLPVECGDDGCGNDVGDCPTGYSCEDGACV